MWSMHDAVTITLIILTVALLRRSLLTSTDAAPGIRAGEKGKPGIPAPVFVETDLPQPVRRHHPKP